jgi:DNA-binding transcriptional regulator YiaG
MSSPQRAPVGRLQTLRQSTELKRSEFAALLGCSYWTLHRAEVGLKLTPELAHRIARELTRLLDRDVSIDEFYDSGDTEARSA